MHPPDQPNLPSPPQPSQLSRRALVRSLLAGGVMAGAGMALLWSSSHQRAPTPPEPPAPSNLSRQDFLALAAAQECILPAGDGSPGARAVGATDYLDRAIGDPRTPLDDLQTVREGLAKLQALARTQHGSPFEDLAPALQVTTLQQWEKDEDGAEWLGVMVVFTLEALLGDPVYGGNRDGCGWASLGLVPAQPRPPGPSRVEHG